MKVIVHVGFQKTRFEDPVHYYFAFVFVKDRKKSLSRWVTSIRLFFIFILFLFLFFSVKKG